MKNTNQNKFTVSLRSHGNEHSSEVHRRNTLLSVLNVVYGRFSSAYGVSVMYMESKKFLMRYVLSFFVFCKLLRSPYIFHLK